MPGKAAPPPTGNVKVIRYKCAGGCKAIPPSLHLTPGDIAVMVAYVDVTVAFTSGSPFQSGVTWFTIPAGGFRAELVGSTYGTYPYTLACQNCPTAALPPEMIVP